MNNGILKSYATFRLGTMRFALEASQVQEFLLEQRLTPVPLAASVIAGLINLRGQIITAVDMRKRLELEPPSEDEARFNIVIRSNDGIRSLIVDEIGDVVDLSSDSFEEPAPTLPAQLRFILSKVCKVNGSMLLILNSSKIFGASAPASK